GPHRADLARDLQHDTQRLTVLLVRQSFATPAAAATLSAASSRHEASSGFRSGPPPPVAYLFQRAAEPLLLSGLACPRSSCTTTCPCAEPRPRSRAAWCSQPLDHWSGELCNRFHNSRWRSWC